MGKQFTRRQILPKLADEIILRLGNLTSITVILTQFTKKRSLDSSCLVQVIAN